MGATPKDDIVRPTFSRKLNPIPCLLAVVGLSVAGHPAFAQDASCAAFAALEVPAAAPDTIPTPAPYDRLVVGDVPLGFGHIRPVDEYHVWDWHRWAKVPLFVEPGGPEPELWLTEGWVVRRGRPPSPLGTSGMIETAYEAPSFIVLDRREDGWLRVRYGRGVDETAWTHECALSMSRHALVLESWAERLTSPDISPLFFIAEVPHVLRGRPSTDGERVMSIPARRQDYQITPVDVRGDWMRVRVTTPQTYCGGPDDVAADVHEGWVKWRDAERGPWLWYYTRGC